MINNPKWLSLDEFKRSLELSPRSVLELIIVSKIGDLLLLQRADEPFSGYWHLPGGFIMKGESLVTCAKRIALKEVRVDEVAIVKKLGFFENLDGDPRGHLHHLCVACKTPAAPEHNTLRYFNSLPSNTIPYQKKFLHELGFN